MPAFLVYIPMYGLNKFFYSTGIHRSLRLLILLIFIPGFSAIGFIAGSIAAALKKTAGSQRDAAE